MGALRDSPWIFARFRPFHAAGANDRETPRCAPVKHKSQLIARHSTSSQPAARAPRCSHGWSELERKSLPELSSVVQSAASEGRCHSRNCIEGTESSNHEPPYYSSIRARNLAVESAFTNRQHSSIRAQTFAVDTQSTINYPVPHMPQTGNCTVLLLECF